MRYMHFRSMLTNVEHQDDVLLFQLGGEAGAAQHLSSSRTRSAAATVALTRGPPARRSLPPSSPGQPVPPPPAPREQGAPSPSKVVANADQQSRVGLTQQLERPPSRTHERSRTQETIRTDASAFLEGVPPEHPTRFATTRSHSLSPRRCERVGRALPSAPVGSFSEPPAVDRCSSPPPRSRSGSPPSSTGGGSAAEILMLGKRRREAGGGGGGATGEPWCGSASNEQGKRQG